MATASKNIRIHGHVQGVYYRAWAVETARSLKLSGWVRNRKDGSVEILAMGPEENISELVNACRKGPPAAQVTGVDVTDAEPEKVTGFVKRETV